MLFLLLLGCESIIGLAETCETACAMLHADEAGSCGYGDDGANYDAGACEKLCASPNADTEWAGCVGNHREEIDVGDDPDPYACGDAIAECGAFPCENPVFRGHEVDCE